MKTLLSVIFAFAVSTLLSSSPLFAADIRIPSYLAKVTVEVTPSDNDAERRLRAHLPQGDASVTLNAVPRTNLFMISVTAADPQAAARRANELAVTVQRALAGEEPPTLLKIWEKAEPPIAPVQQDKNPVQPFSGTVVVPDPSFNSAK